MKKWEIEYTDEFGDWWGQLTEAEQESVNASVLLLEECGPNLRFPHSSGIETSKHDHMRELRTQHEGRHTERFMPLTREERQFFWSGEIKQAITDGMKNMCHLPMAYMTAIWLN